MAKNHGGKLKFYFTEPYEAPLGNKFKYQFEKIVYIAPKGNELDFNFTTAYSAPVGNQFLFDFVEGDSPEPEIKNQYLFPDGIVAEGIPNPHLRIKQMWVRPEGFISNTFGAALVKNKQSFLNVKGWVDSSFGTNKIFNRNFEIQVYGFNSQIFETPSKVYNLKQFIQLSGIDSARYGTAYLQGGVKFVQLGGINSLALGQHKVINTRADQSVQPSGITPLAIPQPNVSPQILTVQGILGTQWGDPYIQRNPNPIGWISERIGTAWVSRSPRFYTVGIGELTQFGSHKVFDGKQTVAPYVPIVGGVFGDIRIRNLNFKIAPLSIEAPPLTDWVNIENHARFYALKGFDSSRYGTASIRNGTPSLTPKNFDSAVFGQALIADRVRRVNTPGFNLMRFGQAIVTKTPQLTPQSISPPELGQATLTLYTRYVVSLGRDLSAIGQPFIAMARRSIKTSGLDFAEIGAPKLSHGVRELLVKGFDHSQYGSSHRTWFRVRTLAPESIFNAELQYNHMVGGSRHIAVKGFEATLFGTRIIPEQQTVIAHTFASMVFGQPKLTKTREYLKVIGFATGGAQPADRWGKATVFNTRQYIVQTFDIDSELNPPKMNGWTSIVNRNRIIGPTGSTMSLFGRPSILNNARPILPIGLDHSKFGVQFVSAGIREIMLEGLEAPYFSGWTNLHNAAAVLKPKGFKTEKFGTAAVTNTRRYYPRVGNFESMVFGQPMISFKIRNLTFESRYSIGPIYLPMPNVQLYTRYVEPVGNDFAVFGLPALTIHKKIITPRWTLRDLFGDVQLRNVTPEVKTKGRNSEEFGTASIRTQWRMIETFGESMQLWGKPVIADRKRTITVAGFNANAIGHALRVRGTASPPLSSQYIYLNNVENRGEDADDDTAIIKDGFGIAIPLDQVSEPSLKTNVIRVEGFIATKFGENNLYSNGILMENGIKLDKECGTPSVQLRRRSLLVEGINNSIAVGAPRLSPYTIHAVMEAPHQAKDNHPVSNLHYVNSDGGSRKAGEVFGRARVWQHNPYLNPSSVHPLNRYGTPTVQLKRRYIEVKGIQAYRFGWHSVGDGTQIITTRPSVPHTVFGVATIALVKDKQFQVKPSGLAAPTINRPIVQHLHRTFKIDGIDSLRMGSSRGGPQYMPQSLHVGPRMPVIPIGELMEKFGTTRISLRVRNLVMTGFDSLVMEYDVANFDKRIRVQHGQGCTPTKPVQHLTPVGFDALRSSASNIRAGVHYIRPDGNSDQFRKGGF